jgi:hypothetical protein
MFYLLGSLLFAVAMMAALAVMIVSFAHYRRAMMIALRSLSMDGLSASAPRLAPVDRFKLQSGMTLRTPQAAV